MLSTSTIWGGPMLTRLVARVDAVSEPAIEYEYEYRDAEYEHDLGGIWH